MSKFISFSILLFMFLTAQSGKLFSQTAKAFVPGIPDPQLGQEDNDFMDRQAAVFLDSVRSVINNFPPARQDGIQRGYAKLLLDAVFHDKFAAFRNPAQNFFHEQAGKAIRELEQTKVGSGLRIWKIYDMGFIVRSRSVTMAFDLVSGATSGSKDFALNSEELDRLVRQCDVLFISHRHADHAEKSVAERFIRSGKPVVSPLQVWANDSISREIQHPERSADKVQTIQLTGGRTLRAVIFPGHQGKGIDNNCVLVTTPEGISVAHIGDQINEGDFMADFEWIDQVSRHHQVDVLMTNAWTMDIFRIVRGFNPGLVLPGHELELGHTVWDRLPYWGDDAYLKLNYAELKKSNYPVIALIWGESVDYRPSR
jgi:L-ascorbate metabolism protein UlaG (beta-lactamase superfamily)